MFGRLVRAVGGVTEVRGGAICADTWIPEVRLTSVVSIPEVWSNGGAKLIPVISGGVEDSPPCGEGTGGGDGVRWDDRFEEEPPP